MRSKLEIRKQIEAIKEEYSINKDKELLLKAAILKGLYLAFNGEKGIPLPNKYSLITSYSKIIFKYKLKINTEKAYSYLYTNLLLSNKIPEYYIDSFPKSNIDIAKLLANIVSDTYTDDIIVNNEVVFNITLDILNRIGEENEDESLLQCWGSI